MRVTASCGIKRADVINTHRDFQLTTNYLYRSWLSMRVGKKAGTEGVFVGLSKPRYLEESISGRQFIK